MSEQMNALQIDPIYFTAPQTAAAQRLLVRLNDHASQADLLFLERWERQPLPGSAAALRVGQIRRAHPELAAEIRAELARGRPLTPAEREALAR